MDATDHHPEAGMK